MGILPSTLKTGKFSSINLLRILNKRLRVGGGGEKYQKLLCFSPRNREGGWVKETYNWYNNFQNFTPTRSKPSIDLLPVTTLPMFLRTSSQSFSYFCVQKCFFVSAEALFQGACWSWTFIPHAYFHAAYRVMLMSTLQGPYNCRVSLVRYSGGSILT